MSDEAMTLRQMTLAILKQSGEQMSYRDLSEAIFKAFPDHRAHLLDLYDHDEKKTGREHRIRLGMIIRQSPTVFTATKTDGYVLVGLAASDTETLEEEDEEEIAEETGALPAVYWYTFPAYKRTDGPYPIKIGRGTNPEARIAQQVTSMPERPEVLGTHEHADVVNLERALHAVLALRGKRKHDAPGTEWFLTTPGEVQELIDFIAAVAQGE